MNLMGRITPASESAGDFLLLLLIEERKVGVGLRVRVRQTRGSWSQCMRRDERSLSMNRPGHQIAGLPWESGAEDARIPNASRLPGVSEPREASGVRPIYRRFPSGAGRPAVHGPNT